MFDLSKISAEIEKYSGLSHNVQGKLFSTALIIILILLIRWLVLRIVRKKVADYKKLYLWHRGANYITTILIIILIGRTWSSGIRSLTTFFGLLGAGFVIVMRELVLNFLGWIFIIWAQPFKIGDRIEVSGQRGDVIDMRLLHFIILEIGNWVDAEQSTGRVLRIPNSVVFGSTFANYTEGFSYIWHEIPVILHFESNWKKAKEILLKIVKKYTDAITPDAEEQVKKAAAHFMIFYKNLSPIIYTKVTKDGIILTIRFLVNARNRRGMDKAIWEDILTEFAKEPDIDFAHHTTRIISQSPAISEQGTSKEKV